MINKQKGYLLIDKSTDELCTLQIISYKIQLSWSS